MNLLSMVNINDNHKERKLNKTSQKTATKNDYGYSIYEALEYGRGNHKHSRFELNNDFVKSTLR